MRGVGWEPSDFAKNHAKLTLLMEASRKPDDDPHDLGKQAAARSRAQLHVVGDGELAASFFEGGLAPDELREPMEFPPTDAPITETTGLVDFDEAASVFVEPTDTPERVIQILRDAGGVYTDEGEFAMGSVQLELLRMGLEGNETALEQLPDGNGLLGWTLANMDSEHAKGVFEQLYCIFYTREPNPEGEMAHEAIASLLEEGVEVNLGNSEAHPEPAQPAPKPPQVSLSKRVWHRLRPRLSEH